MTVRINKQKINLREKLAGVEDKVNFDEVVRGLGEYDGNVGIGTTNPDSALHIDASSSNAKLLINKDGQKVIQVGTAASSTNSGAQFPYLGMFHGDQEDEVVRIYPTGGASWINGGNVGIGTTSPGGKLHVTDLSVSIGNVSVINTGTGVTGGTDLNNKISNGDRIKINGQIFTVSNVAATTLTLSGTPSTAGTFTAYTDSNGLVVTSGGNVGIGTTSLDVKLAVHDTSDPTIELKNSSTFALAGIGLIDEGSTSGSLALKSRLAGGGLLTRVVVKGNGNVGIGTTNPLQKLDVHGSIAINGTIVHSSDDRLKHNEQPIVGALETLSKITPKKYIKTVEMYDADHDFELDADGNPINENGEPVEHRIEAGVIAQQVLTVDELAFAVSPEGVDEDGTVTSPHGLDYNSLFTYAIAAIQEQQQTIEDLKCRIETLEQQ